MLDQENFRVYLLQQLVLLTLPNICNQEWMLCFEKVLYLLAGYLQSRFQDQKERPCANISNCEICSLCICLHSLQFNEISHNEKPILPVFQKISAPCPSIHKVTDHINSSKLLFVHWTSYTCSSHFNSFIPSAYTFNYKCAYSYQEEEEYKELAETAGFVKRNTGWCCTC